jgi:hypothetical protein
MIFPLYYDDRDQPISEGCLSISRLFWVSSLAYPNLLGTKDYDVVGVVDDDSEAGFTSKCHHHV